MMAVLKLPRPAGGGLTWTLRRLTVGPGQSRRSGMAAKGTVRAPGDRRRQRDRAARAAASPGWPPAMGRLPRDDVPMKVPHGWRAHEGARPTRRARSAWLRMPAFRRLYHRKLYTKALEQLGSNQAPVRFSGLYALERLAQDKPAHRQAVVNVICAYLRMPFSPTAPAHKREPTASEGQEGPGTQSGPGTDGISGEWQQEREVRLAAQRILAEHLRDDRDDIAKHMQPTDPPSARFWANIRLDLTGATLIDFNLANGVMAGANFRGATFSRDTSFSGATFTSAARFGRAIFLGAARFGGATFSRDAQFSEATFSRAARFRGATFTSTARFGRATFSRDAQFAGAIFIGDAWFAGAVFGGNAGFRRAGFGGNAGFRRAGFGGDAWFDKAAFTGDAWFGKAAFTGDAWFGKVTFAGDAWFAGATFSRDVWFGGAAFSRGASFGEATFSRDVWFDKATFSRGASFDEAAFTGDAGFDKATITGGAWFGEATFSDGADALHFNQARILSPGASHVWPRGWRLAGADGGRYTVVRAKDDGGS